MNIVAILQARMGSTRLPGKSLLPLAGKPMVQNIIERVMRAKLVNQVILAIPANDLGHFSFGLDCIVWPCGSPEDDLVGRYLEVAEENDADIIVRVPCDNPCVDPFYIDQAIEDYFDEPCVFHSNTTDLIKHGHATYWVDGVGAEVFSMSRLKWLDRKTKGNSEQREHPHKYFLDRYTDNEAPDCGIFMSTHPADIRLDVNTQEDYDFIKSIYDHFGHNRFTTEEVLASTPVQSRLYAEAR